MSAERTVTDLRTSLHSVDPSIIVGGQTATALDSNLTGARDRNLIIPVVLVVITLILMVLLRSVVAPLLLTLATLLSFGTALGVSSLLFNHVLGFPGADPTVPLYGFVFLVALGIDYNIFLMTRVREESLTHGTREGVLGGLVATGGVITSAGVVLAATFAALSVIPDPVPGATRDHRRLRRASRRARGARLVCAGACARRRRPGLVAFAARGAVIGRQSLQLGLILSKMVARTDRARITAVPPGGLEPPHKV